MCLVSVTELIDRTGRFIRTNTHKYNIETPMLRGNTLKIVND